MKFIIAGLPTYTIALLFNYLLVNKLHWPITIAYALVLMVQVSINYFISKRFVFQYKEKTSWLVQYLQFMSGILVFRFFDWLLYSILTQLLPINFILIQLFNIAIFSLLKYRFAKRIIEGK